VTAGNVHWFCQGSRQRCRNEQFRWYIRARYSPILLH
jgi:hypothetical protein